MLWGVVSASGKKEKEPTHLRGDSFFCESYFFVYSATFFTISVWLLASLHSARRAYSSL